MTDLNAYKLVRAKPINLTFYDRLVTYPYTATFYVKDEETEENSLRLVKAIQTMSGCVLGKYKIGYQPYIVKDYESLIGEIDHFVMGTFKWRVTYHNQFRLIRAHTIPGFRREHRRGNRYPGYKKLDDLPDLEHEDWKQFLTVFKEIAVSPEGEKIPDHVEIKPSKANWPPSGWKRPLIISRPPDEA